MTPLPFPNLFGTQSAPRHETEGEYFERLSREAARRERRDRRERVLHRLTRRGGPERRAAH